MKKRMLVLLVLLCMVCSGCQPSGAAETVDLQGEEASWPASSADAPAVSLPEPVSSAIEYTDPLPEPIITYSDAKPDNPVFASQPDSKIAVIMRLSNYESSSGNTVTGKAASYLIDQLKKMKPTGEEGTPVPANGMDWESGSLHLETPNGDYCIERQEDREYRLLQIDAAKNKTYVLGNVPENFVSECYQMCHYWPEDYWYGRYELEPDGRLEIQHRYQGVSEVQVRVISISLKKEGDEYPEMVLELTATKDKTYWVSAKYAPSGDNLDAMAEAATNPAVAVTLTKGVPQRVTIGYPGPCPMNIRVDQTIVHLNLNDYSEYQLRFRKK